MPNPPTSNMALVMPTEGSDDGEWDGLINDAADLIDSHNHTTGRGARIPTAALTIDGDLSMSSLGSYYALRDVKAVDFQPQTAASMSAYAGAFFLNGDDSNNLWFRTHAGTNFRITSGATLDVTTSGGIGGDYAAIPAEVAFVDASKTYTFRSTAAGAWSRLQAGAMRLAEFGTTETVYVELAAPSVLGASYTLTLPSAVPGANGTLMQVATTGAVTFSNAGLAAATFASTVGITGAVTMSSTLGVTGLITATAGATAAANQHITVSGTGRFKHGSRTMVIPTAAAGAASSWPLSVPFATASGAGQFLHWPVTIEAGKRISDVTIYYARAGGTLTFTFQRAPLPSGAAVTIASTTVSSGTSSTSVSLGALSETVSSTQQYYIFVESGAASDVLRAAAVTYEDP